MEWTTACPDWEKRIVAKESLLPCLPLFDDVSEVAKEVFGGLIVPDMPGRPLMKDVMPDWVMDFVGFIFGSLDPEIYHRLIKTFFLLISKKNAKSTIAAGIMITALELNETDFAEATIIAPTKEVADNAFKPAMGMILLDADMREKYTVSKHVKTITHIATESTLKVIAADDKSTGGSKAKYVLIDELHLFGDVGDAESILSEATGGLMSKPDGFVVKLSTQSKNPPAGVFKSELDYAREVRDGKIQDNTYCALIYEFPQHMLDDESCKESQNFYITNPSIGYSVNEEYLLSKFNQKKLTGDEELQEFCAKHLNIEVGLTLRNNRWAGAEFWEQQADESVNSLQILIDRCEAIGFGVDGGGLDDLIGLAAIGRCRDEICESTGEKKWLVWTHALVHEIALERRKENVPKYMDFEKEGSLTIFKRFGEDTDYISARVLEVISAGLLVGIALDPYQINGITDALVNAGVPEDMLKKVDQGSKLSGYIQTAERKLAAGVMVHGGQSLMTWCVGNAKAVLTGNNIKITKQQSGKSKIDPLIALFCVTALMESNPEVNSKSVYEERGIRKI